MRKLTCCVLILLPPAWAAGNYCSDAMDGYKSSSSSWTCTRNVAISLTAGGSGGPANGSYSLSFSGGACTAMPAGKYTVSNGVVTSVWLTPANAAGYYGKCSVAPVVSFPGGPANAAAAVTLAGPAVTVPGDGDIVGIHNHHITIDSNWGTSAGGGIQRIEMYRNTGGAPVLDVDCSSPRSIVFASRGNSPFGSGSATVPASDSNMFGFVNAGGTLNLTCTNNPPSYPSVSGVTYGYPTTFTLAGAAPPTDTGVTVFSPSCPPLDGLVRLVTNIGGNTFTIPVDSSACVARFGSSAQDSLTVNPLTITTADQVSPVYIVATSTWLGTSNAATINTDYLAVNNLGTGTTTVSAPGFCGFGAQGGVISLSRTYVSGGFQFLVGTASGSVNIAKSVAGSGFTANYSNSLISTDTYSSGSVAVNIADFLAAAQTNPVSDLRYAIGGSYLGSPFTLARIAVQGNTIARQNGVSSPGLGATTTNPSLSDVLCLSPGETNFTSGFGTCVKLTVPPSPATINLTGLVSDGPTYATFNSGLGTASGTGTVTDAWAADRPASVTGGNQGIYVTRGGLWNYQRLVGIIDSCSYIGACMIWYGWPGVGAPAGATLDQATLDLNNKDAGAWAPYELWAFSAALRSSLLIGSPTYSGGTAPYRNCGRDVTSITTYSADLLDTGVTVGVHHNATYNCPPGHQWSGELGGINYWDGSHPHPSALYHDIDAADPRRVDPSRRLAGADQVLFGGPGTQDHLFREMMKISGFGGPYTLSTNGQLPIAKIRQWLIQGHTPQNPAYWCAGWNGVSIGAVNFCNQGRAMLGAAAF
ncbi:MAG TPA: hypothetical protein VLW65_09735 [Bryobacteraceae bacterium]|nr:hypothetical protein [Bryobacteraceae bacterium]